MAGLAVISSQRSKVSQMWLAGASLSELSAETSLSLPQLRTHIAKAKDNWRLRLSDPVDLRAKLLGRCELVADHATHYMLTMPNSTTKLGWGKLVLAAVDCQLEVAGLKRVTVRHESDAATALMRALAALGRPATDVPVITDGSVVEGECSVLP